MSKTALSLTPENEGRAASHGIFNNSQKFVKLFWVFYSKEVSWYWKMKKNEKNLLCLLYSQTCGKQFLSSILCELLSSRAGIGGNSWMGGVVSSRRRFATLNGVAFSRRRLDTLDRVTLSRRLLDTLDSVTSPSRPWAASDSSSSIVVESSPVRDGGRRVVSLFLLVVPSAAELAVDSSIKKIKIIKYTAPFIRK